MIKNTYNKLCLFCKKSFKTTNKAKKCCSRSCTMYYIHEQRDPEFQKIINKKSSDKQKGRKVSPDIVEKSKKNRKYNKLTKEHKQKISDSLKGHAVSDETRQKISSSFKKMISKPGYIHPLKNKKIKKEVIEKQLKSRLKSLINKPNKFESRTSEFLNSLNLGKFEYVGDGSLIINGKSPDFINKELNMIVLANGTYFHLGIHGLEVNNENKRIRENIESEKFLEANFNVLFVWEDNKGNIEDIHIYFPRVFSAQGFIQNYSSTLDKFTVYC